MNRELHLRGTAAKLAWLVGTVALASACEGPAGPQGPAGQGADASTPAFDAGPPPPDASGGTVDATTGDGDAATDASLDVTYAQVGPGLMLNVTGATIDATGVVTVSFTVLDGRGSPLDYQGALTAGAVNAKWVISALGPTDGGLPADYTAYTTQVHTSADGKSKAALPDSDLGGTLTQVGAGQGTYQYVFGTKLPKGYDPTATHTIGVWATRVYSGQTYVANTLYPFVPNGSPVTVTRQIVTTKACNQCHNPLGYHEGNTARREAGLCVLCHSAGAVDVSNGQRLDMPGMIHKIHRGRFLPSVLDGGTFQLTEELTFTDAGVDGQVTRPSLVDHSGAWFPGDIQNCGMCHIPPGDAGGGLQANVWQTTPTISVCSSCHDRTDFVGDAGAGWTVHTGGGQPADSCGNASCHGAGAHFNPQFVHQTAATDPNAATLVLAINRVTGTSPGSTPVVHFSVTANGKPVNILNNPLPWLAVTLAGPTTDYAQGEPLLFAIENGSTGTGLVADGPDGSYAFTLPTTIPGDATGSYAVGMEGYLTPVAAPGAPPLLYTQPWAALNPVYPFAVTDGSAVPRRTVIDRYKCNSCHYDLVAHEGTRKSPEYCVLCHTSNKVADQNAPRFEVASTQAPSLTFKFMVHKIHRGSQLAQGYVVGGLPAPTLANPAGTPVDFGKVRFPGDLRACWACHDSTSYLPPLQAGLLPVVTSQTLTCADPTLTPGAYCTNRDAGAVTKLGAIGAACVGCHDIPSDVSHAASNMAPDNSEGCVVCHGSGKPWDVQVMHMLAP